MACVPISVVIPCYMVSDTVMRAVESVVNQSLLPKEIILIDDCSVDEGRTRQALYRIKKTYEMSLIDIIIIELDNNRGAATARNMGWEKASQTYIAFLDADDVWHKNKLKIQYQWMESHKDVLLSGHCYQKINNLLEYNREKKELAGAVYIKKNILFKNYFATPTIMLRNTTSYRFKQGKRYAEDYLLWAEIALNAKVVLLNVSLAGIFKADYGEGGLSAQLWNMEKGEISTYFTLYNKNQISLILWLILINWSMAKYLLRVIKTAVRG